MEELRKDADGQVILPQPDELPKKIRDDAMGAYLMMFAAAGLGLPLPIIGIIAAVIYHFTNKNKSRFVAFHSLQSLLSQLPVSLMNIGLVIWFLSNIFRENGEFTDYFWYYLAFTAFWNLIYFIFSLIGAVRAYHGRFYYFWFIGPIAFDRYYGSRAKKDPVSYTNTPPRHYN